MSHSAELLKLLASSYSQFHSCNNIAQVLLEQGFSELEEGRPWDIAPGGKYFVKRNESSLAAFRVGAALDNYHFQVVSSHSDSPLFKLKPHPVLSDEKGSRLLLEAYGGPIDASWFDRPLYVAGRVLVRTEAGLESRLFVSERPWAQIPHVAIHLKRDMNAKLEINRATDIVAVLGAGEMSEADFFAKLAKGLACAAEDIVAHDLFVTNAAAPELVGLRQDLISAAKLDDLECAFGSLMSFVEAEAPKDFVSVYFCFDNEEVGSETKQGALSTFAKDVLERLNLSLGFGEGDLKRAYAKSFMVSADNAHAVHPNHPELYDRDNAPRLGAGVVIKTAANQHYCSDAFSIAVFSEICKKAGVKQQIFANRSDMAGGSTLGNLLNMQISWHAVDIGLPQLAMHSIQELAALSDFEDFVGALKAFYETDLVIEGAKSVSFGPKE